MDELDWLGPAAPHLRALGALLQPWVDALLRTSAESGWALLALGALMLLLGRQGDRPLMAAAVALGAAWVEKRLSLHLPGPPLAAALGLGAAAGVFPRPAMSLGFAAAGWVGGAALAAQLGQPALLVSPAAAALAFAISWFNQSALRVLLPPLGAAVALTGAAARLAVGLRAEHPHLARASWLLLIAAGTAVVLIPLALEREVIGARLRRKRAETAEQKKKEAEKADRREKMSRYLNKAG